MNTYLIAYCWSIFIHYFSFHVSDSPNQPPGAGGMSSSSGGVPHPMASTGAASSSGQAGSTSAAAAVVAAASASTSGSSGNSNLLWTKTQQLPEEAFRQLHSIYGDHFPLEARHHLAGKILHIGFWSSSKAWAFWELKIGLLDVIRFPAKGNIPVDWIF